MTDGCSTPSAESAHPRPHERRPKVVGADLLTQTDTIASALLDPSAFSDERPEEARWLRERYAELVPLLLPDALRAVSTGARLSPDTLQHVRASAVSAQQTSVPFRTAIRGAVPALRTFSALIQALDQPLSAADATVLMGRAALIAQELAATWHDAWRANSPAGASGELVLDAPAPDTNGDALTGSERRMIVLTAEGLSTEQVAAETAYSPQAVKWHLRRLMRAWNVPNRPALVAVAFIRGVLTGNRNVSNPEGGPAALTALPDGDDPAAVSRLSPAPRDD